MPRTYQPQDAARARRQYYLDQGVSDVAIESWPVTGWTAEGSTDFVYRDGDGKELCRVHFIDEEGTALVGFPSGESGAVYITEDEGVED